MRQENECSWRYINLKKCLILSTWLILIFIIYRKLCFPINKPWCKCIQQKSIGKIIILRNCMLGKRWLLLSYQHISSFQYYFCPKSWAAETKELQISKAAKSNILYIVVHPTSGKKNKEIKLMQWSLNLKNQRALICLMYFNANKIISYSILMGFSFRQ